MQRQEQLNTRTQPSTSHHDINLLHLSLEVRNDIIVVPLELVEILFLLLGILGTTTQSANRTHARTHSTGP